MLRGLGLEELAACSGLSPSQVNNILKHSHARNNRAVLFNLCAALLIHISDITQTECPDLKDEIERIRCTGRHCSVRKESKLLHCTADTVTGETIAIGNLPRKRVLESNLFRNSPNGRYIVNTLLSTCLLPTVEFHVLFRTGNTDLLDSFWLRFNNILQTTGHLKYQELYLFYAFFKSIMPRVTLSDLYDQKPGAMVARVPTFTGRMGSPYDMRGWVYVQLDELLELLIIRMMKGLNVIMLPYLESAGSWLLVVASARMVIRTVTAAAKSFKPTRNDDTSKHGDNLLQCYDKNAAQSRTVCAMVELMRRKGFLSPEHRAAEKLRNVFGDAVEVLDDMNAQEMILDLENYGRKSAELHSSAMLPDVFGQMTDADIKNHFNGKRFKGEWTKLRQVPTASVVMANHREKNVTQSLQPSKHPKKAMSDRRYVLNKLMTSLTLAEHGARSGGDMLGAEHVRERWRVLYSARYLLSPFADAYRTIHWNVRHAAKSQILAALNLEFMGETSNTAYTSVSSPQAGRRGVSFYYDYHMPLYSSVMIDVMNHIWARGTDGRRGNSLFAVTLLKMKELLRSWFTGRRSKNLKQLHLHVDDPSNVVPQKHGEQARRDSSREMTRGSKSFWRRRAI